MFWEYLENTLQLSLTIVMLLVSLYQYISTQKRGWSYLVVCFLGTLVSTYHWTAYLLIMGESPNSSDAMIYIGWNVAFAVLLLLIWHIKPREERRYFHPLMLLPIPLNIYQLTLYLPYGAVNSTYQVTVLTATACLAIQSILWHRKQKQEGKETPEEARKTLLPAAVLTLVCCEFGMWTSTCMDEPVSNLYYPFSILGSLSYLFIGWAATRALGTGLKNAEAPGRKTENVLKAAYFTMVVLLCAFGGIMVGSWMRDTIQAGLQEGTEVSAYDVIPVILFIFSLVIVVFAMATVVVVYAGKKGAGRNPGGEAADDGGAARANEDGTARADSLPGFGVWAGRTEKERRRNNLIIPLLLILGLMVIMVVYTSRAINNVTVSNLHEIGEDKISGVEAKLDNYLESNKSVVRVSADTVNHMVRNGRTTEEILDYLLEESAILAEQFNEDYTGLYGYIQGEYLDGLAWVPPEGYDPVQRDWYISAVEAGGDIVIVPPYLDAQTGDIIISMCRRLSDERDVLSLDITMNSIQEMTKELQIRDKGYGFIVDNDGLIVAHPDITRKGQTLGETEEEQRFLEQMRETRDGIFEMSILGKESTVFVKPILDQWYVIISISNEELYSEHWKQMAVNVLICSVIFALIALFYFLGNRNEQNFSRKMEEMKMEEQKQAYETRVLKLEKEAADQANKAKSDFLAEMSHEIRTPINAVLGMNEMILRECDRNGSMFPADQEDAFRSISACAANIENAGKNLLSIINDILDFSKIESGRMEIAEGRYELSSLLNDVSSLIAFRAREKGLEFRIDADQMIPDALYGDIIRVRQVITNLLSNAVKYTDRGSIGLEVRSEEKEYTAGGPVTLRFTIRDTGIGIREEDIPKLFTKFQRVDLDRNSTVEGTGLGLAITRSLLEMMGGSIQVESEYGKGSVFTVLLPQTVISCEPMGSITPAADKAGAGTAAYRESFRAPEARILVVDDTRMNIEVATGLLKKTGVRADTAQSGPEALEKLQANAYDAVLMDQRMPGMDGTEVLHRLRAMKGTPNEKTPVVCMTADAVIGARERYTAEGFDDYLPKPVSGGTLEKILLKYLTAEKVTIVRQGDAGPEAADAPVCDERYRPLQDAGIEPGTGLEYCQQDKALYETLLAEYTRSAGEKTEAMQANYGAENWKEYGILVHALKSTSRMIGAETLARAAEALEKAAKEGNADYIRTHHEDAMRRYGIAAEAARKVTGTAEAAVPEDEILEFPPV